MQLLLKRVGWLILAGSTIWLLFFYSTEQEVADDGKVHLRYWLATGQKEQIPYSITAFNAAQDSIVIDVTIIPWQEHEKKILTAILSGDPPDIISQFNPVAQWASRMALTPLDAFMKKEQFDSTIFFPALWKEMKWFGETYALPVQTASYAFFYNNELFRKAGLDPSQPPKTWDDVAAYSKKLLEYDAQERIKQVGFISEYGVLPGHGDMATTTLMAWQLGAGFVNKQQSQAQMTHPAVLQALEWVTTFQKGYNAKKLATFMSSFGFADQHAFLSDKVAMMCLQNTFIEQIDNYRPDMDYTVCTIPSFPGTPTASASGSFWIGIPRGAKKAKYAWQYLKYATGKQMQLNELQSMDEPLFPGNRFAAYDSSFINRGANKIFIEQMDYAHSPAIIPLIHGVFWREFAGARERAVKGLQTPKEALTQAQNQIQLALDKARDYDVYVRKTIREEALNE